MTHHEIIERIMTAHWDMAACHCWICIEGRRLGCGPRDRYLSEIRRYPCRMLPQEPQEKDQFKVWL